MRAISSGTILTIDADWVMTPTALRAFAEHPETQVTPESLVYPYSGRPDAAFHEISIPAKDLAATLLSAGLRNVPIYVSRDHDGMLDVVERHRPVRKQRGGFYEVSRIVCFDAHLDIYPETIVDLDVNDPGKKVIRAYWFENADDVIGRLSLDGGDAEAIRGVYEAELEQSRKLSAWVNFVSFAMHKVKAPLELIWVVPFHFERAMSREFMYPNAQWLESLRIGERLRLWDYELDARDMRIRIRPFHGADIVVRMRGLGWFQEGKRLKDVNVIHLCLSPKLSAPTVDLWWQDLVSELARGNKITFLEK